MSQVTVISGTERRRSWSADQKRALVAATLEPGANVSEIARQADIRPSQLFRWRRDLDESASGGFAAVTIATDRAETSSSGSAVVVEMGGVLVRVAADASPTLVATVLRSLR